MVFEIKNKVALVTGGASGIGLEYVKQLLRNGAKGVTIADVNSKLGDIALQDISEEFGLNRAVFVQVDVSNRSQFKDAFEKTIEVFKNLDILINNAGILNDAQWEKEVAININGTINGITLAHETYIADHKSGEEGVIVNISSIAGISRYPVIPIYSGTKFAITGLTVGFGDEVHFKRTKIRVIGICPGGTISDMCTSPFERLLGPSYVELMKTGMSVEPMQSSEECALGVIKVLKNAPSGTMWVVEEGKQPYQFEIPDRNGIRLQNNLELNNV